MERRGSAVGENFFPKPGRTTVRGGRAAWVVPLRCANVTTWFKESKPEDFQPNHLNECWYCRVTRGMEMYKRYLYIST